MQKRAHLRRVFGVRRSTLLFLFYIVFYILYLITGGFMFAAFEAPLERSIRNKLIEKRRQFLDTYPNVQDSDLEALIQAVVRASNQGVSAVNNVSSEPNWSFGQSLFFSSTVVTTIGYGHVTPLSKEGKIFCILYAMLGIPLTLMLLTALVERLMIPATMFLQFLNRRLGHKCSPFHIRLIHFLIIVMILVTSWMFMPSMVFSYIEPGWDFLDSFYYSFISVTTIGLGDYIPGDSPTQRYRALYKVLATVYLFIGLVFMMFALTLFNEMPELNVGVLFMMEADERTANPERVHLRSSASLPPNYSATGRRPIQVNNVTSGTMMTTNTATTTTATTTAAGTATAVVTSAAVTTTFTSTTTSTTTPTTASAATMITTQMKI